MEVVKKMMTVALIGILLLCAGCQRDVIEYVPKPATQPTTQPTTQSIQTEKTEPAHWTFPAQTVIVGVDVGGLDVEQAWQAVQSAVNTYVLQAAVNDCGIQISAEQVKLSVSEQSVRAYAQMLKDGGEATAPLAEFDNSQLKDLLASQCQTAAVNASVYYNAGKDTFEISKERNGFSVNVQEAAEQVGKVLQTLGTDCRVTVGQETLKPCVFSNDQRLKNAVGEANEYLDISLTYMYAPEQVEVQYQSLTADDIGKMIGFNSSYAPYVSTDAVKRYADAMNQKYAVRARFKTTGGGYINVNVSGISQAVDTAALAKDLENCLKSHTGGTRNAPYKTAVGAAAVWNGNYVEIDLTRQHLWVYKNGKCVVSTPIVSGCVAKDMETPTGVYSVTYKTKNVTLRGPDWNDFVSYWMPFFGNYGMHDASWRSSFGSDIYLYEGSHGCVNIPVSAAGQVYNNISSGTKVILYGGVTDVKLEERSFSGTTEYKLIPGAAPFRLNITSQDAPTLSYTSDAPQVAEVAADGTVTVKGVGTAKITVSAPAHGRHGAGSVTVKITVAYDCSAGHTFTWTTTLKPSCAPGSQTGVCPCGHSEQRVLEPVTEHVFGPWQTDVAPGCEQEGKQSRICTVCGETQSETVSSTGHSFTWTTTLEPSCAPGSQTGVCPCGHSEQRVLEPVTEHVFGPWQTDVAPGCEQEGKQSRICTVCGENQSETVSSTGHDFGSGESCANGCGTAKSNDSSQ